MKLLVLPMALLPEPMLSPGAIDFILQEVDMDPKPAQEYFGFAFKKLEEGLRTYLLKRVSEYRFRALSWCCLAFALQSFGPR